MNYFIKNIKINKLFHLQNFEIAIPKETPHLIITGKNGSGKTILLKAIADFLDIVKEDKYMEFLNYYKNLEYRKKRTSNTPQGILQENQQVAYYQKMIDQLFGRVNLGLIDSAKLIEGFQKKDFIISFYGNIYAWFWWFSHIFGCERNQAWARN